MNCEEFYNIYLHHPQICTDSRKSNPGCLYFALRGERFDGNAFAADALKNGCAYAVVDNPDVVDGDRFILVPDVLAFLQELALLHRSRLSIPVIGLTGTNGKTTTKELIHSVLRQKFRTVATSGNLNNHIGVPLTILEAGPDTEILIVEMGANHPGEIAFLCGIARPDHGLITNIGMAHLEGFGSYEGVIRTKNELYRWIIQSGGQLFVNGDDPLLLDLAGDYPAFRYGTSEDCDVTGSDAGSHKLMHISWKLKGQAGNNSIGSHLTGGYQLYNVLAAIAIGSRFGLNPGQIRTGIESYVPVNMRSQWLTTAANTIFLDAYNANPSSMQQAVSHFASLELDKTVAILGDMFELGDQSDSEHLKVIRMAAGLGFGRLLFTGRHFSRFASEFPFDFFETTEDLMRFFGSNPLTGCHILIKGSRGMKMERLVDCL